MLDDKNNQGNSKRTRSAYRNTNDALLNEDASAIKVSYTSRYQNDDTNAFEEIDEDCNHHLQDLNFTVDKTVFEKSFLDQIKKNKRKYPIECKRCGVEFRSK